MHYILGTSFITPARLGTGATERQFTPNTAYQLIYIQKKDEKGVVYTFFTGKRERVEVVFTSCREADKLIARFKKENIPDYEAQYTSELTQEES